MADGSCIANECNDNSISKVRVADSFSVENALERSAYLTVSYQQKHLMECAEGSPGAINDFAMARLEWAMRQGRIALSAVITENEFMTLCDVFNSDITTPGELENMATAVADQYDIDYKNYQNSGFGPLLDKLTGLSAIQKLALRDLVQQFWYPTSGPINSIADFMAENGVTAAPAGV